MVRSKAAKKKDHQEEQQAAPEPAVSGTVEVAELPTKTSGRKGEKRKASATKAASPKKKAKTAAATLALFSDIEAVGDLPEIESPPVPAEPEAPPADAEPAPTTTTQSPSKKKDDNNDSEVEDRNSAPANTPSNIVPLGRPEHRTLSAALRKGSATIPFVVSNQMALSGEIPTAARALSSLETTAKEFVAGTSAGAVVIRERGEIIADQCPKVFECHHCRRVYFNIYSLRMHVRQQHTNSGRKIRCPHCKFVFFKLSGLRDHLHRGRCEKIKAEEKKKEAEKKLKEVIEKGEGEEEGEQTQSQSVSDDTSNDVPDRSDEKVNRLNYHISRMIFEPLLEKAMCIVEQKDDQQKPGSRKRDPTQSMINKCELCSRAYEQRDSLRRHYKQVHIYLTAEQVKAKMKALKPPQVVFKCLVPDCKKVIPSKKMFKVHYKTCHTSIFNELVEQQMRDMDDSVLYECPTCGKSYFLEASYLKHRQECGDIDEDDGFEIDIDYDLLNEPWIETKEDFPTRGRRGKAGELSRSDSTPDTQCRYCGKLFFTIYGRIDHERKHSRGEIPEQKPVVAAAPQEESSNVEEVAEEGRASPTIKVEGPIIIRCMDCNKQFHSFEALDRHHSSFHVPKASGLLRSQLKA